MVDMTGETKRVIMVQFQFWLVELLDLFGEIVRVGDSKKNALLAESRINVALLSHFSGITAKSIFCFSFFMLPWRGIWLGITFSPCSIVHTVS